MDELELLTEKWDEIMLSVKNEYDIPEIAYKTWISKMEPYSVKGDTLTILAPNQFEDGLKLIESKYRNYFIVEIYNAVNKEYDIKFISDNDARTIQEEKNSTAYNESDKTQVFSNLNPKYTFETFVVGDNNRMPYSAALAVAENPGKVYNPLFIYGGAGLGKTHLMHSIGHYINHKYPEKKVRYVTSENFTNDVVESLRIGDVQTMARLRDKYRTVDVLLLDDVQFIIGKDRTQAEFFNTFNELQINNKAIILSSDKHPEEMEIEDRLLSRFEWGLPVSINPPDYETRVAILRQYADNLSIKIDDEIIEYLATNIKSNIRKLEGALNRVMALKNLEGDNISLEKVRRAIADMITSDLATKPTMERILEQVTLYYNIKEDDILSKKRTREIALARHVAMYLFRELTDYSLSDIGKFLGNRDHTTVIHGCDNISKELSTNHQLERQINELKELIIPTKST